jgi:uncharacterized membrane protein
MDYLWLKALHIVAIVTWIGGMLAVAISVEAVKGVPEGREKVSQLALLETIRRWDHRVTSPAMVLAWILGLTLALKGGWSPQTWFVVKFVLVLALSALHGVLSGRLRRLLHSDEQVGVPPYAAVGILVATALIVVLVVVKPI